MADEKKEKLQIGNFLASKAPQERKPLADGPTQPAPPITPIRIGDRLRSIPSITPSREPQSQPSLSVNPSRPAADPVTIAPPTLTRPAPTTPVTFVPNQNAVVPAPAPFVPDPNAVLPSPPSFAPDPNAVLPDMPAPRKSVPAGLPLPPEFQPDPNATLPGPPAFQPDPNSVLPDPLPFTPDPNAVLPGPPAFQPDPNSVLPGPPAFQPDPNSVLPPMPAPPLITPALLPPPPPFVPDPNAVLPPPPPFVPDPNAVLPGPPAFIPNPNSVLPGPPAFQPDPNSVLPGPPAFQPDPNSVLPGPPAFQPLPNAVLPPRPPFNPKPNAKLPKPTDFVPASNAVLPEQLPPFIPPPTPLPVILPGQYVSTPVPPTPGNGPIPFEPARAGDQARHDEIILALDQAALGLGKAEEARRKFINQYSEDNPYQDDNASSFFDLGSLTARGADPSTLLSTPNLQILEPGSSKTNIAQLYTPVAVTLSPGAWFNPNIASKRATNRSLPGSGDKLAKAYYRSGVIPAKLPGENDFSFIQTTIRREDPTKHVDDDEAYVPLSFMDLRPMVGSNQVRTVYFRPFITNLTEEFAPDWNRQNYFGRVDQVATYMATARSVNLGFRVHAFAPEDLEVIYQKKHWLESMCYPSYDKDILFKAGPIVRLRVGDLLKTRGGYGLPGIIESLSFDYSDQVWELQKGSKVPMGFSVAISFLVLHETPIGIGLDGQFGGIGRIDPGSGIWSPPQATDNSRSQNAPEMSDDAISDFAGGPGSKLNGYHSK